MPSYSASVRPSSRCAADVLTRGDQLVHVRRERREQRAAVGGPGERVHGVLGVGHQPHHVPGALATPAMSLTDPFGFWPGP